MNTRSQQQQAHNISTVIFVHNPENDFGSALNVLFELTRNLDELKLKKNDVVIALNKVDIRGKTKDIIVTEDVERPQHRKLLAKNRDQLCIWDVLKHPYDATFKRSPNLQYEPSRVYG